MWDERKGVSLKPEKVIESVGQGTIGSLSLSFERKDNMVCRVSDSKERMDGWMRMDGM